MSLRHVFDWWVQGLRNLVPAALLKTGTHELVAVPDQEGPGSLVLWQAQNGIQERTGNLDELGARPRSALVRQVRRGRMTPVLALPQKALATRRTTLPAVAEKELRDVIGLDIDRLTPFNSDEVFFTHRVLERLDDQDRIVVEVLYAPKATLEPALERLKSVGLPVSRLDGLDASGLPQGVNLLGPSGRQPWRGGARLSMVLTLGLFLSIAAWIWAEMDLMDRQIAELGQTLAEERELAFGAEEALDGSGQGDLEVRAFALRQDTPRAVEVMAAVTEIVPDHTWLDRLNLDQGRLEISGSSPDATELIGAFERHPMFERPVFPTPLTRARGSDVERFFLTTDVPGMEVE